MNDIEKKYWKKVYMYFGDDFESWYLDEALFEDEYFDLLERGEIQDYYEFVRENGYVTLDGTKFTQKFIEEISHDE